MTVVSLDRGGSLPPPHLRETPSIALAVACGLRRSHPVCCPLSSIQSTNAQWCGEEAAAQRGSPAGWGQVPSGWLLPIDENRSVEP